MKMESRDACLFELMYNAVRLLRLSPGGGDICQCVNGKPGCMSLRDDVQRRRCGSVSRLVVQKTIFMPKGELVDGNRRGVEMCAARLSVSLGAVLAEPFYLN